MSQCQLVRKQNVWPMQSFWTDLLYSATAAQTQSRRLICGEAALLILAASRKIKTKSKQEGLTFSDRRVARP